MRRGGPPSSVLSGSSFREAGHQEQPHSAAAAQPHPGPTARSPPRRRPRTPPAATAPAPTPGRGVVVDDQHGPGHRPIVAWAKCASHRGYPGLPRATPWISDLPPGRTTPCLRRCCGRAARSKPGPAEGIGEVVQTIRLGCRDRAFTRQGSAQRVLAEAPIIAPLHRTTACHHGGTRTESWARPTGRGGGGDQRSGSSAAHASASK
jgi:hypothetical protein